MKEWELKLINQRIKDLTHHNSLNLWGRPKDWKVKIVVRLIKLDKRFKTWEKPYKHLGCNGYSCLMDRTDMKTMIIESLTDAHLFYF